MAATQSSFQGMNVTANITEDYYDKVKYDVKTATALYVPLLIVCLFGNILVCVTVMSNREMRSKRWYYFLVNLAVADMAFALVTPFRLAHVLFYDIGTAGCKISAHSMNTFILASTFTLAYISIERYMCICHPRVTFLKEITGRIILGLWLVSITIMLPYLIFCKAGKGQTSSCDCHSEWSSLQYYTTFKFVTVIVGFLVPLLTMLVCYSQICIRLWGQNGKRSSIENDQSGKKKRSIKMMILATLLFFISWFPYMALFLVKAVGAGDPSIVGKLYLYSQVLAFSNSVWNPFTYCLLSKEFRKGFKKIMICRRTRVGNDVQDRS